MEKAKIILVALVLVTALLLPSCVTGVAASSSDLQVSVPQAPAAYIEDVADYFPIDVGREWTYKVTFGEANPLFYQEVFWSLSGDKSVHDRAIRWIDSSPGEEGLLKMKIERQAVTQGPLSWPIGVKLVILKDELKLFKNQKEIFWAITKDGGFFALQITTYSPESFQLSGSYQSIPIGDGVSKKIAFFDAKPDTSKNIEDSPDELYFKGVETNLIGYGGISCLHFQRQVALSTIAQKYYNLSPQPEEKDFTEDIWFAKGIGLVRLEQMVKNKSSEAWEPSMTWTLVSGPDARPIVTY